MSDVKKPNGEPADGDRPEVSAAAGKVASGEPVNWSGLESSVPDEATREVLAQLRRVEGIAAFHRAWQGVPPTALPGAPGRPATWGALTIIEEIGRGSSGRVYRARDPRLDREVALKILEPGLASDSPVGRAVIEEGRHLAQLRHPNIVAIHGADRIDGRVGLEMELVTGQTLAETMRMHGPLGADEATIIGRDVCRALAAVHRAGLVHRDVKVQNVIRESGGRIVLMDLGAGRPVHAIESAGIAGTPLYLAPEVLAGAPPTPRSDLYSVGVLLYHLVTGSFPVTASSLVDLCEAHRLRMTTRLRDARPDLPERFINLVERAIEPDPAKRIDGAGRFEAELSQLLGHAERSPGKTSAGRWPVMAGAAVVLAIAAATWALWPRSDAARLPARFDVVVDGHLTIPHGPGSREFALSPDGTQLVYSSMDAGLRWRDSHAVLRPMNAVAQTVIATPGGQPFFKPDGTRIGLFGTNLTSVSLTGGPLVTLTQRDAAGGGAWGPDGTIVFSSEGNLWRIPEGGGTPVRLTQISGSDGDAAIRPQILDTGEVLFTYRQRGGTQSSIAVLTRGGAIKVVVDNATSGKYLPPGYLVFVAGDPPWITAAHFDVRTLSVGRSVPLEPVKSGSHWFDVSRSGSLAFSIPETPDPSAAPAVVWVDRDTGRERPLKASLVPGEFLAYSLRLSPDGRKAAYTRLPSSLLETVDSPQPGPLVIADLEREGGGTPLINEPVHPLTWSRDGTKITYRTLSGAIAWRPVNGSGREEILADPRPDLKCNAADWSPDGRVLLLGCGAPTGAEIHRTLMTLTFPTADAAGKTKVAPELYLEERGQGAARFSPDGRWVTYSSNIPGEKGARVFVRAFPGPGQLEPISAALGRFPQWRGNELFYLSPYPTAVRVRTASTFGFDRPQPFGPDFSGYDLLNAGRLVFAMSGDGRRVLVQKIASGRGGDYLTRITVVLNWVEEVRRKLDGAPR